MRTYRTFLLLLILGLLFATVHVWGANPWEIRINIPEYKLYLYRAGEMVQTFYIAVGKAQTPSPLGDFWIANKVVNPTWYPPDHKPPVPPGPENPLGKYWMGLNIDGFGIHGNSASWSIGNPISLGCFRMYNDDVQKLFELVPVRTPVKIVYDTIHARVDEMKRAWLEIYPDIYHWINQEAEIQNQLQSIGWEYEPHWIALRELLNGKKPLQIEVPRKIKVESENSAKEGFFWKNNLYIAKKDSTPYTNTMKSTVEASPFTDYLQIDKVGLTENQQFVWDENNNTLKIQSLKLCFKGIVKKNVLRWRKEESFFVELKTVAELLDAKFIWDNKSAAAICNGIMIPGDIYENSFWVEMGAIERIWPGVTFHWDENNGTLELFRE